MLDHGLLRGMALAFLGTAAILSGCRPQSAVHWKYEIGSENGVARLTLDRTAFLLEPVPLAMTGYTGADDLQVAGSGQGVGSLESGPVKVQSAYRDGIATVTVNGFALRIVDGGSAVEVGSRRISLTPPPATIRVRADGSAVVE